MGKPVKKQKHINLSRYVWDALMRKRGTCKACLLLSLEEEDALFDLYSKSKAALKLMPDLIKDAFGKTVPVESLRSHFQRRERHLSNMRETAKLLRAVGRGEKS
ncbi:MAG: hypothetical protein QXS54_03140 [Candidatus Methanomethylicaceae archaeon]